VALTIVLLERRVHLARGRAFALYLMLYTAGRGVIETMRTDEANHILGVRLNVWTSVIVFAGGTYLFWRMGRTRHTDVDDEPAAADGSGDGSAGDHARSQHPD